MAIAQEAGEVRAYGQIGGTLEAEPCGQDARTTGSSIIRGQSLFPPGRIILTPGRSAGLRPAGASPDTVALIIPPSCCSKVLRLTEPRSGWEQRLFPCR